MSVHGTWDKNSQDNLEQFAEMLDDTSQIVLQTLYSRCIYPTA